MKRKLTAVAVSAALAAPAALADVSVGGIMHLNYGAIDEEAYNDVGVQTLDSDDWEMNNRASRVRIKGSEDLGNGLKANFFIEWGTSPDEGGGRGNSGDGQNGGGDGGFSRRNQWVGLSGDTWGETRFGRHDTPLKFTQGKYDVFNDQQGDIANITLGENRVDNVLAYISPDFSGFKFAVAGIPGESNEATAGANTDKDGFADYWSAAATYGNGPFYVMAGYDYFDGDANAVGATSLQDDRWRVLGTYAAGAFQVGALYETTDFDDSGAANATTQYDVWGVSGKYSFGNNAVKAMYHASTREQNGASDEDGYMWSAGFDHNFSKRTMVYAEYTYQEDENKSTLAGSIDDDEYTFAGVGIKHKF